MNKKPAFTILEVILIVATILILAVIVFIAINPAKSFTETRNTQREENISQIANAIYQYNVTNGRFPLGISSEWQVIGTGVDTCQIDCGKGKIGTTTDFSNTANSAATFNGSFDNTTFNTATGFLEMTSAGRTNGSASYTSPIFDAINSTTWQSILQLPKSPYGKELPNNHTAETGYETDSMNMSNNFLLLHLNEISGSTVIDSSGYNHNGTLYDSSKYLQNQDGIFNRAVTFTNNSTNDNGQIRIPHHPDLNLGTQGTICAFVKTTDLTQRYAGFVHKGQQSNFSDEEYTLQMWTTDGKPLFNVPDTTGADHMIISSVAIQPGNWTHICGSYNTSGSIKIYINGQLTGTTAWPAGRNKRNLSGSLQIGGQLISSPEYGMKGSIDEVALFNRELTLSEIQTINNRARQRIKYQVRSCEQEDCADASFVGPDGTTSNFYSEADGLTPQNFIINNISDNRYFQYKVLFETSYSSLTPQLKSFAINGSTAGIVTGNQCLDLNPDLVEEFIVNIPTDPQLGSQENTYYAVKATSPHRIAVKSCAAEAGLEIEVAK